MTERDVWDFFDGTATIKKALPVLTILTLPATGSEMNGGTVITNEETKQKYGFIDSHLCPKVSILDPTLTFSVTPEYTAFSAVDAFSHLTEGYFTHKAEWVPLQDRYVEGLVKTIIESIERILKDPEDYNARATMMWAASLAWNGLGTAGIGDFGVPAHMLEHSLSAIYDIAHGAGLSIVIPAWMTYALKEGNVNIEKFAENVFDIRTGSSEEKTQKGIAALRAWFEKIGSPTSFSHANIPAADIDMIAENARMTAELWGLTDYTKEIIAEIYRMCL
jgi:alcohol dehydrogenase YqhD (iron-dependent ADH family)